MPRTGRPKVDNPRDHVVSVRLTATEREQCAAAADNAGDSISNWIRTKAVAAAKRSKR